MDKHKTNVLKNLIERIIIPRFAFLKLHDIQVFPLTNFYEYDVRFITRKKILVNEQSEIIREVKTLFKMASLDSISPKKTKENQIIIWFKSPKAKEFSYQANQEI